MKITAARVLLTGATGGLGHAIARGLAAKGAHLVLTGRRPDVLQPLAAEIGGEALQADLCERAAIDLLVDRAGEVDILVANAGLPADGPIDGYTIDQLDRALDVNLRAPIVLARVLSESMVSRGRGHLVFISSISGKTATPGSALYSATKFGLRGFSSGMRQDLHGTGVGVSAIFPGPIRDAGMFAMTEVTLPKGSGTRSPDDVASAVVRAIERNRSEIDVASLPMRVGAAISGFAPAAAEAFNRRVGAAKFAAAIANSEAHRARR